MSLLANSNAIESGGYNIDRSLRFRSSASAYLSRTPASVGNRQKFTISAWIKRGRLPAGSSFLIADDGTYYFGASFDSSEKLAVFQAQAGSPNYGCVSNQVFRDVSAWYHIVISVDTTQVTAANRIRVYVNGSEITMTTTGFTQIPQNYSTNWNNTNVHQISSFTRAGQYQDLYWAEVNSIDGQQLTPSSFGQTDPVTGVWTPKKYTGTYGTNGFYLPFSDNTSATTLAYDKSGNSNNWTPNNISTTAGATYDSMTDVPTLTSATAANYCVLNPLDKYTSMTVADGNLTATWTGNSTVVTRSTIAIPSSGKYYWEALISGTGQCMVGVGAANMTLISPTGTFVTYQEAGLKFVNGANSAYGASFASGDTIGIAYDADANTINFYKNNASQGAISLTAGITYFPVVTCYNATIYSNFGQRPFSYTPPTGFKALNTFNLPDPTIKKPNQYMDATTWTGNSGSQSVTNSGFQPDFVWIKNRSNAYSHILQDAVRGVGKTLQSNATTAEQNNGVLTSFDASGFSLNNGTGDNVGNLVGWQWKKGATPGFDIVTFTSPASGNFTVNHSLGVTPAMVIVKTRDTAGWNWHVWHKSLASATNSVLVLNSTAAVNSSFNMWGASGATSTTIGITTGNPVPANSACVAYLFAEIAGFSKFGSYTGNGSADGPFVYCGFRPKYILVKRTDTSVHDWGVLDASRNPYNVITNSLQPNLSNAEYTAESVDFTSNGFKIRQTSNTWNGSGGTFIYAAFAENPFKYSNAR